MPAALADATLVRAYLDENDDQTELVYSETESAVTAYDQECAGRFIDCDYRNWFSALNLLEDAAQKHGNLGLATSAALQMLKIARDAGDRPREALALAVGALTAQRNDEPAVATRRLEEAHAVALASGSPPTMVYVDELEAINHFMRHEQDAARLSHLAALDLAERAHLFRAAAHIRANLGDCYVTLKQPELAMQVMAPALAEVRLHGTVGLERLLLHNTTLAEIALRKGGYRDDLRRVVDLWARSGSPRIRVMAFQDLSTALVAVGDTEAALDLFQQEQQIVFATDSDHDMLVRLLEQQQAALRNRNSERQAWLAAVAVAVLVAVAIAASATHLRRRNRRLAVRNEALRREVHLDPLTGLANRHGLDAIVGQNREAGVRGLLYLIDLDHFKRINDELGHAAGDAVLVETGRRLKSVTRETDVVVRWGGEEFLVFMPSLAREAARDFSLRLLTILAELAIEVDGSQTHVTASIGYACFPLVDEALAVTFEQAFAIVDAAMYSSKSSGRNRATGICSIEPDLAADAERLARTFGVMVQQGSVRLETTIGPHRVDAEKVLTAHL